MYSAAHMPACMQVIEAASAATRASRDQAAGARPAQASGQGARVCMLLYVPRGAALPQHQAMTSWRPIINVARCPGARCGQKVNAALACAPHPLGRVVAPQVGACCPRLWRRSRRRRRHLTGS